MADLEELLNTVKTRMHSQYLQYCDINIPIQKCALLLGRLLIGKFEVLVRQQNLRGLNAEESAARATEETLTLTCDTIEVGIEIKTDELLNNYQWLFSTFADYHLLTYALWHLCVRPDARGADRAWNIVNHLFALVETKGWPTPGSKWNVLRKLREKAADVRRQQASLQTQSSTMMAPAVDLNVPVQQQHQVPMVAADLQHQHLQQHQQQVDQAILDAAATAPMFTDGMAWDFDSLCYPDWGGYSSGF